jgi:hypothetical protein
MATAPRQRRPARERSGLYRERFAFDKGFADDLDLPNQPTSVIPADATIEKARVPSSPMGQDGSQSTSTRQDAPHLSLVPSHRSDRRDSPPRAKAKATWPFAPDERTHASEHKTVDVVPVDPAEQKHKYEDLPAPKSKKPSHASAKVRAIPGRRRNSTGSIIIPGIALPPATEAQDSQPIRLKRHESVIAEAAKERKGLWRVGAIAKRATTEVASALQNMGYAAVSVLGQRSVNAVRHFEALPRKKQIMWVAAPYAVVLFLVLVLVELKEPSRASATVISPASAAASIEETGHPPAPAPQPATPAAQTQVADKPSGAEEKITPSDALPLVLPGDKNSRISRSVWKTVPIASSLRVKPDPNALKVSRLKAGARAIIYPDFPTREGWVLAQRPGGEIGFMVASHIDGKKDPRFDKIKDKKSKRTSKIDPFTELKHPRHAR